MSINILNKKKAPKGLTSFAIPDQGLTSFAIPDQGLTSFAIPDLPEWQGS
jgi:hypothetical protein